MASGKVKKLLSFVLTLAMVFSLLPQMVFASDYERHWSANNIRDLLDNKIISADENGNVSPEVEITRGEFLKAINNVLYLTDLAEVEFDDLEDDDSLYAEVQKAVAKGYLEGYEDNTVRLYEPINRAEAAKLLAVALELDESPYAVSDFSDVSTGHWAAGYIGALARNNIINGYSDGTFKPDANIKNGEAFKLAAYTDRELNMYLRAGQTYGIAKVTPEETEENIEENSEEIINENSEEIDEVYDVNTIETDKNIIVMGDGVTIQNVVTSKNIVITEWVGDGSATLNDVKAVEVGVFGGGSESIHMLNCDIIKIKVNDKNGTVRIEIGGITIIGEILFNSGGRLDVIGDDVQVDIITLDMHVTGEGKPVRINGNLSNTDIIIKSINTVLELLNAIVKSVTVEKNASNAMIILAAQAVIRYLEINAPATVVGDGKVEEANIQSDGVEMENEPDQFTPGSQNPDIDNDSDKDEPTELTPEEEDPIIKVKHVSLDKEELVLKLGEPNLTVSETLTVTFEPTRPTNRRVTWTSSNEEAATVENGVVTAKAVGETVITVETNDGGFKATCNVTVTQGVLGVTIKTPDGFESPLYVGETLALTAVFEPENASNKNVKWETSNEAVATVSEDGVVTAKSDGPVKITVTTEDGEKTDSIDINIETSVAPSISNKTGYEFDLKANKPNHKDLVITGVNLGNGELKATGIESVVITSGSKECADFSLSGTELTIPMSNLTDLVEGSYTIAVTFNDINSTVEEIELEVVESLPEYTIAYSLTVGEFKLQLQMDGNSSQEEAILYVFNSDPRAMIWADVPLFSGETTGNPDQQPHITSGARYIIIVGENDEADQEIFDSEDANDADTIASKYPNVYAGTL